MGFKVLIPFWLGATDSSFYQTFVTGISDALRELGHEPSYFPFDNPSDISQNERASLIRQLDRERPGAVLDVACWGYATSQVSVQRNVTAPNSIFDDYNIAYAGMLFDQPFNQAINGILARRRYAVYPDLGHPTLVKIVYPELQLVGEIMAPPAVNPTNLGELNDRPIEVLYVGNFHRSSATRFWRNLDFQRSKPNIDPGFCEALMDLMMADPDRSLHLSVEAARQQYSLPERFDFQENLSVAEYHLRQVYRLTAILALAKSNLRLDVVGTGWRDIDLPATVKVHECITYQEFLRLAGMAQVTIDASTYLDGVNDRVFSYAVKGAVCFTNAGGYLRPIVGEDAGIQFYSMRDPHTMVDRIKELLARPSELAQMGARAREVVLGSHTWRHRVEQILAAMTK